MVDICTAAVLFLQLCSVSNGDQGGSDLLPMIDFVGFRFPLPRIPLTRQIKSTTDCPQSCVGSVGTDKPDGPWDSEMMTCDKAAWLSTVDDQERGSREDCSVFPVFTLSYVVARHGPGLRDCSTDHLTAVVELRGPGPMFVKFSTAASNKRGDRVADRGIMVEPGLASREEKASIIACQRIRVDGWITRCPIS